MKLPAELRAKIFEQALGPIQPHASDGSAGPSETRLVLGSKSENNPEYFPRGKYTTNRQRRADLEHVHAPNHALLQVTKVVHDEALQAGWLGTKKYFIDPRFL